MVNGKQKGDSFENAVCRALSRWFDPTLPEKVKLADLPFRRRSTAIMPLAGHWEGNGDILHRPDLPHPWPFCVECKHVEGWELDGILANGGWVVWTWWSQAVEQAARDSAVPLLVFTRNRRTLCALLHEKTARCLRIEPRNGPVLKVATPAGESLVLARLDDLTAVPPSNLGNVSRPRSSRRSSRTGPGSPSPTHASSGPKR